MYKSVLLKSLTPVCLISIMGIFSGCRSAVDQQQISQPVFFPNPPETPRLQFLKSYSGPDDLGIVKAGAFEKFVLGEPETVEGISKPYGVAISRSKLYVCDVGKRMVEMFDLENGTFGYLTKDQRLMNPVNIYIDDDNIKYVADPTVGAVFVFDQNNNLIDMLGKELKINPIDVVVRGHRCYVTDFGSNRVFVLDRNTGKEIARIGIENKTDRKINSFAELPAGEFSLISDLALDQRGNVYVTDKAAGRITMFDQSGKFIKTIGRVGKNIDEFVRPKGIAIDKENRIWVVDASTEVAKIYNQQAQLLLFFGLPGNKPGMMNLPAKIVLDYDNVELFRKYAVPGANIEFLVLVSNQYGPNKISVYGFGSFPTGQDTLDTQRQVALKSESENELKQQINKSPPVAKAEPQIKNDQLEQQEKIAELYYSSMTLYRSGRLDEAREGLVKVLKSGLIPPAMIKTIQNDLDEINNLLDDNKKKREIAELYYSSIEFYNTGRLEKAREGLVKVLKSGLIPPAMAKTIEQYLVDIENSLNKR
jgi:YVTN family beta-propeller protein